MILVLDTSSARAGAALLRDGDVVAEAVHPAGRDLDLPGAVDGLLGSRRRDGITAVALALGPGSFTGLRAGISYGLGLAIGLQVPVIGLGTLELQAARAPGPVVALAEAGRGRLYYLAPDGRRGVAPPEELPAGWPRLGWLRTPVADMVPEAEVRSFGAAAGELAARAERIPYGTVRPVYMHGAGSSA